RQKKIITECWNYMLGTDSRPDVNFGPASGDIRSIPVRIAALEESVRNLNGKKTAAGEAIEKLCRLASETDFSTLMTEDLKTVTESQLENLEQIFKAASGYQNRLEPAKEATSSFRDNIPYYRSVMSFIKYITPLEGLYALLDELLKEINSQKRITGSLSFKDAGEMALKVLLENEDIRNQEKRAYKKIMIDEFQDNNGKNRDLLYILALKDGEFEDKGKCVISAGEDGSLVSAIIEKNSSGTIINDRREEGKLFFVGDEKQSIYKFRGADVSVFNELTASGENSILAMNCNFRSTPFLLSAFNRIFAGGQGIFLNGNTGKADYEAYYERPALKYGLEKLPELNASNIPLHACFVNSNFLKNAEDSDRYIPAKEQSAYNMARKISSLAKKGASWSDFAILDKSRTDRKIITKYLNMFNIPYSLDENRDIFQEAIVNDFYSFLRLCVYPSDVNSYAAYLCSPLAGLNEKDVEQILSIMIPDDDPDFVFNAEEYTFPERIKTALSEDKFNKFLKAIDFYRENAHKVLRQKITLTLTELWHKKGYKYETFLDPNLNLLSEQFDMLFELSRSADENQKSVSWFIDELNKLKSVFTSADSDLSASDITYPVEQDSAVSIMTIHKSKGLQFRHVFIWGCTDVTAKTTSKHYSDEKTGFAFTTPDGENFFKLRTKNLALLMETAEYRRLIYVAVTRAEEDAWITGLWNPEAKESKSAFRLFENLAMKYYSPAFKEDPSVRKNKIYFTEGAPFDFEDVHCITYDEIAGSLAHNDLDETRAEKIESSQGKYAQAEELSFNCSAVPHKTPSGLEDDD
ncbi:MAG: UvrD-helicase domain-containing protein, partial [Treponema sp.]|nr:UvrD-helicase domain-containing protein [Treponema sp.]